MSINSELTLRSQVFKQIQADLERNPPRSTMKNGQTAISWILKYCDDAIACKHAELPGDLKVRRVFFSYMAPRVEIACKNLIERHTKLHATIKNSEEPVFVMIGQKINRPEIKTVEAELNLLKNWEKEPKILLSFTR